MARNNTPNQLAVRQLTSHCALCERKLYDSGKQKRTIEHFYPFILGQELNRVWNKIITCKRCNRMKGSKMPAQFIERCIKARRIPGSEFDMDLKDIIKNTKRLITEIEPWFRMRDLL